MPETLRRSPVVLVNDTLPRIADDGRSNHHEEHSVPLAGRANVPFVTPGVIVLAVLAAGGLATLAARLIFGLGAVTHLNNQYPWGIWIAIDVACGVALAAGGFTTAFLAHVLHIGRFHPVVRPALLTAAIGYTFVGLGVCVDLGRYYNIWHVPLPPFWQGNSALFEVGMCVMIYLTVLYIEFLPLICERFMDRVSLPGPLRVLNGFLNGVLRVADRTLSKTMTFFIIAGVVLSCAHQSSLGTLMAIAPSKLHPLWHTAVLPLLFLLSAFAVGLSMAIFEGLIAARSFKRPFEMHVLSPLGRLIPFLLTVYLGAKLIDLVNRRAISFLFQPSLQTFMFWAEILIGVIVPIFLFMSHSLRRRPGWLFTSAAMVVLGTVLNRINVFLIGYTPPYSTGRYVPAWTEVLLTVGFISLIVLIYRTWVWIFPVLPEVERTEHA